MNATFCYFYCELLEGAMMKESSLISYYIESRGNNLLLNVLFIFLGLAILTCLSQVVIPLPFTPVPITGQTFGVIIISMLWGAPRSLSILTGYLLLGSLGVPVFAGGASGLVGPTMGYLIGMLMASYLVGLLSDLGYAKTFKAALLVAYLGSLVIFASGLVGLSFFIPKETLLISGLYPFLLGDFCKNILAAFIVSRLTH